MKYLEKLFFHTKMEWRRVLLLAVACGVIPGLLMVPKALEGTSLQEPGISYEFWIFMALLIALNCEKPLDAGLKTFVFFLISQPLIYLVQVPFSSLGWQLFNYYPEWGIVTLFTLPGGMCAWYTRKGNVLSLALFSVVNVILCAELPGAVVQLFRSFPKFLVTALFIAAEIAGFNLLLFRKKGMRIAAFAVTAAFLALAVWYEWSIAIRPVECTFGTELEGAEPFTVISEYDGVDIRTEGNSLWLTTTGYLICPVEVEDADGVLTVLNFSYTEEGQSWGNEKDGEEIVITEETGEITAEPAGEEEK